MIDILIFAVIYALLAAGNLIRLVKGPNSINVMDTITSSIRQAAFLQDGKSYFAQKTYTVHTNGKQY